MANKKSGLNFLNQSVLLEEAGLPKANILIILVVFLMVTLFIAWSLMMNMDQVVKVSGQVKIEGGTTVLSALVPAKNIADIQEGLPTYITITGINDNKPVKGTIERIDKTPKTNQQGASFYEAAVKPEGDGVKELEKLLLPGMDTKVEIVVGSRTLFQYLVGPVFNARNNAFKEN